MFHSLDSTGRTRGQVARAPRVNARSFLPLLALFTLGVTAGAQRTFHVSTTSPIPLGTGTLDDGSIVTAGDVFGSLTPQPFFVEGHWQGVAGFVPGDIDGLARLPFQPAGSASSFAFSFLSNEGGFLDGDILGFAPGGGIEVLFPESELVAALGLPGSTSIDVDAFDFDNQGCLYFSVQSDQSGTIFGTLLDGDVVCYSRAAGQATMWLTEAAVQTCFEIASGLTAAIGDVRGLEFVAGEIWVVPQAPSSHDGGVFSCGPNPMIIIDESDMGLGGAEIDALSTASSAENIPTLDISPFTAQPGEVLTVRFRGKSNTVYVPLLAGTTGWFEFSTRPGFGAVYLDPNDPWLVALLAGPGLPFVTTDVFGNYLGQWPLPSGSLFGPGFDAEDGWSCQVLELPSLTLSAPFRVLAK